MATPKTPRKRDNKANTAENAGTGEPMVDATDAMNDLRTPPVEDAVVVLDEPDAQQKSAPEAEMGDATPPMGDATPPNETPPNDPPPLDKKLDQPKTPPAPERAADPASVTVKSGPGFVPLVLGGVVAAGIGFGLARYVVPEGWPTPGTSPLQVQLSEQAKEIADLRAQVQALPKDDGSAALVSEVEQLRATAASALEAAEAAQQAAAANNPDQTSAIADLTARLAAVESRPATESTADPAVIDNLKADIATLQSGLAAQKASADAMVEAAEVARSEAAAEAQTVLLQAALTKVEAAMQNGLPFADELAQLAGAGLTIPAILTENAETGLPTIAALADGFDAPARAALKASLRGNMGSTWSERVGSFLQSQTGARSLTPQEGDDPDAVLSRADAAVEAGDLQSALTEIKALPEAAQAELAGWVAQVKLRHDAQSATAELAAALGER